VRGNRRWLAVLGATAVGVLAVWALLRTPPPAPQTAAPGAAQSPGTAAPTPGPTPQRLPTVRVEQPAITTVDAGGRPQWDLRAQSIAVDGNAGLATLTNVSGTYFEAGKPSATIKAARGVFTIATRNVTLMGGVHAESASGRTLDAQTVKWFPKTQQVEALGAVVLRQRGMTVRADRLIADLALQRTKMSGNIKVTMHE
jgi:LPS export ABC transporter protein LptC